MNSAKGIFLILAVAGLFFGCSHLPNRDSSQPLKPDTQGSVASNSNTETERKILELGQTVQEENIPKPDGRIAHSPAARLDSINSTNRANSSSKLASEGDSIEPSQEMEVIEKESETVRQIQPILDEALDFCEVAQSFWEKGELENALEALDKAYSLIIDIDPGQEAKLIQQKEDLRFLISKRILEIYASRNIVVNGGHDEIPMEMNRHIAAELERFNNGEKSFFRDSFRRSGIYRPYIVQALKEAGLPEDLSWLPLIESGFKVRAMSKARALGLWQFIPSTGYKFGLKRTQYIDERIDFIKATHAAINYLKELHSLFGDWATVLAAYNCGEGRVLQVIRTQNVNYLDNFWDLYERLPQETARYVPRFFATLQMVKNPEKYGLDQIELDQPMIYEEIEINRQVHLKDISSATGISLEDLRNLNPELRYQLVPPEPYALKVPPGCLAQDISTQVNTIPTSTLPQRSYGWHRVRSGETLSVIAKRYRTTVNQIMQANNMRTSVIQIGKRLKVPHLGHSVSDSAEAAATPIPVTGTHYVRKGDSLWNIAKRYGTTVHKIQSLNGMRSGNLVIGQALRIPGFKTEPLPDQNQLITYYVKRGDTPFTIAKKHNMPLDKLLLINKLNPRSKIFPGQKLYIE